MPICSYVIHPQPGRRNALCARLAELPGCMVQTAANAEILVLVTDTTDDAAESRLHHVLKTNTDIACMTLVFAHRADEGDAPC